MTSVVQVLHENNENLSVVKDIYKKAHRNYKQASKQLYCKLFARTQMG